MSVKMSVDRSAGPVDGRDRHERDEPDEQRVLDQVLRLFVSRERPQTSVMKFMTFLRASFETRNAVCAKCGQARSVTTAPTQRQRNRCATHREQTAGNGCKRLVRGVSYGHRGSAGAERKRARRPRVLAGRTFVTDRRDFVGRRSMTKRNTPRALAVEPA